MQSFFLRFLLLTDIILFIRKAEIAPKGEYPFKRNNFA